MYLYDNNDNSSNNNAFVVSGIPDRDNIVNHIVPEASSLSSDHTAALKLPCCARRY